MADKGTDHKDIPAGDGPPAADSRPPGAGTEAGTEEPVLDVPDPDEDDLDDLDDMLNDFSAVKVASEKKKEPNAPGRPQAKDAEPEIPLSDDDFAKELQAGMAQLLGELENSPEMQAQFESIFKEFGSGAAEPSPALNQPTPAAGAGVGAGADASFQHTIQETMRRMQDSGDRATSEAAAAGESSDDLLAEMLKQMQAGGGGLEGEANEAEFSKMLVGMMEQLTNKEILYEPMKELNDRFPAWLEKNKDTVDKADLTRYQEQQTLVREIVAKFEEPSYSDSHAADREYIVERMQKMQATGAPPTDLVGDMPSAQEAFNVPDESCNPQ